MKKVKIPQDFFKNNRARLSKKLKSRSLAIIHANDEMNRTADQFYPYRQNSDLFYLSGINQEKSVLMITPDHPDENLREVLFIRRPEASLETWEGHKLTQAESTEISGIQSVKYLENMDSMLAGLMLYAENVYVNPPELPKFIPEFPNRDVRFADNLRNRFPAHRYERLAPLLRDLRMIKSEEEVVLIRKACNITKDAFLRILKFIRPGVMEYEIEAEITHEFISKGARGHAYIPIIASGINACTLHYINNDNVCNKEDLVLMDFGAEYGNYAADCTRTLPVSGRFTKRQKELYQALLDVFNFAVSLMKPGSSINMVHTEVCRRFEQEHIKFGLYTIEDLKNQDAANPLFQRFYMHGTSHFLGLDVHDVGTKDAVFSAGMVLTCEPAIYIPEEKTGIRLENNILITKDGNVDLMKDIPILPEDIERLMAG
jgi:Xaa-Pro aminopeptidase